MSWLPAAEWRGFEARSRNCENRLFASSCLSVCPSARMEQLGSHWTDFHEILYFRSFRKSVDKIQLSLKPGQNKRQFFFFENRAIYGIMWGKVVEADRPHMAIWRMRVASWIPKATKTHSEYVILNAFPLQQWLQERVSMLRYTCSDWIVNSWNRKFNEITFRITDQT